MSFEDVRRLMDDSVQNHEVPCSDIVVTHHGRQVFRYMNGTRDDAKKVPLDGKERYILYSCTKPITCTAALMLYEKGKLKLEDKVSDYIPEYEKLWVKTQNGVKQAETPLTVKHLFTMTSGLNYNLECESIKKQILKKPASSTLEIVRALAGEPLEFEPGTHFLYSLSHDVLAAVIEKAADMSFGEYLKKYIFDVCGMKRTGFVLDDFVRSELCSQYEYEEQTKHVKRIGRENQYQLTQKYESGGAGLVSCVDDYISFATKMANGNELLRKETIDLMRAGHIKGQAYQDFQGVKNGYSYGLGVRTDAEGNYASKGEFGWDGAAGAYTLIDPDHQLAVFYATHVKNYGCYLYDILHPAIRDAVYGELEQEF